MSRLAVTKGKVAERAVANLLNPIIAAACEREGVEVCKLARNLKQTQVGGFDLDGLDWIAIEIKHHKTVAINSWWEQTLRQATNGRIPVLIWKQNGQKWRVRMNGQVALLEGQSVRATVDISLDCFLSWFELMLMHQIRKGLPVGERAPQVDEIETRQPSARVAPALVDVCEPAVKRPWE